MTELRPDPFTPPDVDLRGLEYMPVFGDRLVNSETWVSGSAESNLASFHLWWHAYAHEVPAASLPDNDALLARYAGGLTKAVWRKVKQQALRGWVLCSDGRLHHKFLADIAAKAWKERVRNRKKQEEFRQRQAEKANGPSPGHVTVTQPGRNGMTDGYVTPGSEVKGSEESNVHVLQSPTSPREALKTGEAAFSDPDQLRWIESIDTAMGASWTSQHRTRWADFPEIVRSWRADGFSLETEVVPMVRASIATCGKIPDGPRYFDKALRNTRQRQRNGNGQRPATPSDFTPEHTLWAQRLRLHKRDGTWNPEWGARPGDDGCAVPPELLNGTEQLAANGNGK